MVDNNMNVIYFNKINVTPAYAINSTNITIDITLLPGTNLIDLYCQNATPGTAGLVFKVTNATTGVVLTRSNVDVRYKLV